MQAFTHFKPQGSTNQIDYLAIKAAILANGTMLGTHEFAKRSNLKYKRLKRAEDNYLRLNSLKYAADLVVDQMMSLPIFELFRLSDKWHGNVDGTKKKTKRRHLKARYSSKYFGLDIGVVIMTMGLGYIPFATNIIGANEYEGNYVFSMLYNSNNIITPDVVSTDTAGTNNVNDFFYYLIGKTHAPCYRSIVDWANKICGFEAPSHYKDYIIKPEYRVNEEKIRKCWPEVIPILYSVLNHDSGQEKIVQQLSSHDYKSQVKEAIWELNHILKSVHILKYIDDPQYQRDIRTALNRGEAYHQLLNKIADVGGGEFRGMSEIELDIWNECLRFLALIIIYYNMHLLSKLYEISKKNNDQAAIKFLKHISPIASQHLNIGGLYEFSEIISQIDVAPSLAIMEKVLAEALKK